MCIDESSASKGTDAGGAQEKPRRRANDTEPEDPFCILLDESRRKSRPLSANCGFGRGAPGFTDRHSTVHPIAWIGGDPPSSVSSVLFCRYEYCDTGSTVCFLGAPLPPTICMSQKDRPADRFSMSHTTHTSFSVSHFNLLPLFIGFSVFSHLPFERSGVAD